MSTVTHLQKALEEHDRELERARQAVGALEDQREILATALKAIGGSTVRIQGPLNGKAKPKPAKVIDTEAFATAVRELGGSADNEALKAYFEVDSGNALTGGRTGAMREGLVVFKDGVYTLVD